MDSGHHYQAALLWLLKHSACMQLMLFPLWHHFFSRQSDRKKQFGNSNVEGTLSLVCSKYFVPLWTGLCCLEYILMADTI